MYYTRRRNYSESQLKAKSELEEKVVFSSTVSTRNNMAVPTDLTTEELNKSKLRSIARGRRFQYELPKTEIIRSKNGDNDKVVPLVYNTKQSHIDRVSVRRYKTTLCKNLPGCPYGDQCKYAHNYQELTTYRGMQQCLNEYFEKTKIGKLEHHELCQNQQCPIRLRMLLKKTVICKYWEEDQCSRTESTCCYAHGDWDRKPLPKNELCKKNITGQCNLANTECVYAHGKAELRKFGATKVKPTTSTDNVDEGFHELSTGQTSGYEEPLRRIDESASSSSDDDQNCEDGDDPVLCEPCQFLRDNLPMPFQKPYFTL